jgi:hypothetical protein
VHGHSLRASATPISWSECDSKHTYDIASGTASPDPPVVSDFINLNIDIVFNDDVNVVGNYVALAFTAENAPAPIPLYSQEFPSNYPGSYSAGDEYTDSIKWYIPPFAPYGHYQVRIATHGPSRTDDVYACIQADFDISS